MSGAEKRARTGVDDDPRTGKARLGQFRKEIRHVEGAELSKRKRLKA